MASRRSSYLLFRNSFFIRSYSGCRYRSAHRMIQFAIVFADRFRLYRANSLSWRASGIPFTYFVRVHENSIEPKSVVFLPTEGTKTEVHYFNFVEKYREQLGIDAIVHIEILKRYDTNSDPENVLELLEEYVQFRENKMFE